MANRFCSSEKAQVPGTCGGFGSTGRANRRPLNSQAAMWNIRQRRPRETASYSRITTGKCVCIASRRGSRSSGVAASSSFEADPHFSPDGRHIAFNSGRSGKVAIWVAAADGSDPRQLTSHRWGWQGSPKWSPDGRTIAFDAFDPDDHVHVWTIPAEGGTPRRITEPTGDQTVPTWSRDGKWIYFSEAHEGRSC